MSITSIIVKERLVVEPEIYDGILDALNELHQEHVAANEIIRELRQAYESGVLVILNDTAEVTQHFAPKVAPAEFPLDEYQEKIMGQMIAELSKAGLRVNYDRPSLDITLTGTVGDLLPHTPCGNVFLTDLGDSVSYNQKITIRVDGQSMLRLHHWGASDRKRWYQRMARYLGYPESHHAWKDARDYYKALDEYAQDSMISIMLTPEPWIADWDQQLVLGKSYFRLL